MGTSGLKIGVPQKTPNPTTTDLTPHLRPSDYAHADAPLDSSAVLAREAAFGMKNQKGDNDNVCLHPWELQMPHVKRLFHFARQKRDNTSAVKMLHQISFRSCSCCPCAGAASFEAKNSK